MGGLVLTSAVSLSHSLSMASFLLWPSAAISSLRENVSLELLLSIIYRGTQALSVNLCAATVPHSRRTHIHLIPEPSFKVLQVGIYFGGDILEDAGLQGEDFIAGDGRGKDRLWLLISCRLHVPACTNKDGDITQSRINVY